MKNILITGITGFVGSHLCDYILDNHKHLKVFGTKRYHLSRLEHVKHFYSRINWFDCDITDSRATLELIEETKPDIIFHLLLKVLFHHLGTPKEIYGCKLFRNSKSIRCSTKTE